MTTTHLLRRTRPLWILALGAAAAGCSGEAATVGGKPTDDSTEPGAAALFTSTGGGSASDALLGVWGGSTSSGASDLDVRLRFAEDAILVAIRARVGGDRSPMAALRVAASVSDEQIRVLESKEDLRDNGRVRASIVVKPKTFPKCTPLEKLEPGVLPTRTECFERTSRGLVLRDMWTRGNLELTKLSD